jgi:hypothetical protein
MRKKTSTSYLVLLFVLGLAAPTGLSAQQLTYPPRPGERDFVVDEAGLLSPEDAKVVRELCDKLLTEKKVPIIAVTIRSMAIYGAGGWDIRVYAQNLFNSWGIGFTDWNNGTCFWLPGRIARRVSSSAPTGRAARMPNASGSWTRSSFPSSRKGLIRKVSFKACEGSMPWRGS